MTVAVGETAYTLGTDSCSGLGLRWTADELDAAIKGPVAAILFDDAGKTEIKNILAGLAETGFEQEGLRRVLSDFGLFEDWRVGEALAETYLTDHRDCYFPWPDGHDKRKRRSSLPGADLVGFGIDDHGDCFAFSEVKTSSETKHPPSVIHGQKGLTHQLKNLRDNVSIRDDLVRYLAHRAKSTDCIARFQRAGKRYLKDNSDIQLSGVLIRDIEPHQNGLRASIEQLAQRCPSATRIEFLALYLPTGSINGISDAIDAVRTGSAS